MPKRRLPLPPRYNAAEDLLTRNLAAGRGVRTAYIDDAGSLTFAELDDRCRRFAGALLRAGFRREERVLLCAFDTIDFPTVFLGCLLAGVVPVAVNTLLTTETTPTCWSTAGRGRWWSRRNCCRRCARQ
jgi:benzoate-CoA ligase